MKKNICLNTIIKRIEIALEECCLKTGLVSFSGMPGDYMLAQILVPFYNTGKNLEIQVHVKKKWNGKIELWKREKSGTQMLKTCALHNLVDELMDAKRELTKVN